MISEDADRSKNQSRGPGYVQERGHQDKAEWVGPSPEPFKEARLSLNELRDDMHRVMHMMAMAVSQNTTALGRSAASARALAMTASFYSRLAPKRRWQRRKRARRSTSWRRVATIPTKPRKVARHTPRFARRPRRLCQASPGSRPGQATDGAGRIATWSVSRRALFRRPRQVDRRVVVPVP